MPVKRNQYLIQKLGAGSHKVGSVVELTEAEAEFYKAKIQPVLEVATPKPKKRTASKPKEEKPAE